ncbi:MAG: TonB-dependent receptor [Gemmatimonadota bacterium]|jgi:hypothetical protein
MTRMSRTILRLGVLLALVWPAALAAQSRTTSAVRGTVTLADGTPLADVTVTVRQQETGASRSAATNQAGRFLFPVLQPGGPYSLTVSRLGYAEETREGMQLSVGETRTVDVVLREEAVELEGIEVGVERTEVFNPSQVGIATRLTERMVEEMPILSRNIMELAVLSPLVKTTEQGGFSVAGQNDRYNSILVDGVLNKDMFGLTAGGVPGGQAGAKLIPLDAVAQYEILIAPFDVRLSGFTGGVMNAVTRTGTNQWRIQGQGVHRNEVLLGDLTLPTGSTDTDGVDRSLVSLSVGGPIIRDEAHFFVTGEWEKRTQPPPGFNLFRDDLALVKVSESEATDFQEVLASQYGLDAGTAAPYSLGQELTNVFARLDWNFDNGLRLTARNVFARAQNDETPNRSAFDPYGLSSNGVFRTSTNNTTSIQLFSDFGTTGANELNLNVQHTSDQSAPVSDYPQVEVDLRSDIGGATFERGVRAGSEFFAQRNDLTQTTVRLTNSLTLNHENSAYKLGVTGAYYDIEHLYLPGATGSYFFANVDDLEQNVPQRWQRTLLADGIDPAVNFSVLEWGVFVQNQIDAGKGLTMRFGIRLDVPTVLDTPEENPVIADVFEQSTASLPENAWLISPRWGFNWQSDGPRRTQVRGGAGMFTGQLPFIWLSNAFHNNGLRSRTLYCEGKYTDADNTAGTAAPFDPSTPATACFGGSAPRVLRSVTVFQDGFKYPQDLKFSIGVDQELTDRVSGSLGLLFSKALNQVGLEELNLDDPSDLGDLENLEGFGGLQRRYFGHAATDGFAPNREQPGYDQVLLATNDGEDWAFSGSAELRGPITDRLSFQLGYAFSRSWDRTSLIFSDMISNYGFNPTGFNPNDPGLTTSNFDRPHKVVATVFGAPFEALPNTRISLLYTGQSGLPFSYVYGEDMNGDGYPGVGPAFDRFNDLVYVPNEASEVNSGFATQRLLAAALRTDECLAEHKGDILPRNACRAPWQNRLDLRVSHELQLGDAAVRFEGDLINVLNFLNSDWGRIQSIRSVANLLDVSRQIILGRPGPLSAQWAGPILPAEDEEGETVFDPADPWNVLSPDSQWQMQFGARVTFGGNR